MAANKSILTPLNLGVHRVLFSKSAGTPQIQLKIPLTVCCLQETVNSPTTCDQTGTSNASQGWEGDVGERDFELEIGGAS